jgi:hypothetical protein
MPWEGLAQKEGDVNVFYFDGDLPEDVRAPAIMEPDEMVSEKTVSKEVKKTKEVKPKYKSHYDPKQKGSQATKNYKFKYGTGSESLFNTDKRDK